MLHLTHFQYVVLTPIHVVADPARKEMSLSITHQHHITQVQGSFYTQAPVLVPFL